MGQRSFFHNWSGPYILLEKTSPTNFRVDHAHNNEPLKNMVHVNRMKPFHYRSIMPPQPTVITEGEMHDITDLNPRDADFIQQNTHQQQIKHDNVVPTVSTKPTLTTVAEGPSLRRNIPGLPLFHDISPFTGHVNKEIPETSPVQQDSQGGKQGSGNGGRTSRRETLLPPLTDSQDDEYEIHKIVKARYDKAGNLHYLIDWKGYPASERTYEPFENLNEAAKEYVSSHDIPTIGKQPVVNKEE